MSKPKTDPPRPLTKEQQEQAIAIARQSVNFRLEKTFPVYFELFCKLYLSFDKNIVESHMEILEILKFFKEHSLPALKEGIEKDII